MTHRLLFQAEHQKERLCVAGVQRLLASTAAILRHDFCVDLYQTPVLWFTCLSLPPGQDVHGQVAPKEVELVRRDFAANGGWETFLTFEDPAQDILVGLLRLRRVSGRVAERQPELRGRCSIVRELHVYGTAVAVHSRDASKHQHQACTLSCGAVSMAE